MNVVRRELETHELDNLRTEPFNCLEFICLRTRIETVEQSDLVYIVQEVSILPGGSMIKV